MTEAALLFRFEPGDASPVPRAHPEQTTAYPLRLVVDSATSGGIEPQAALEQMRAALARLPEDEISPEDPLDIQDRGGHRRSVAGTADARASRSAR